jgi:thiol-disulfide isomerase/thioredoxin
MQSRTLVIFLAVAALLGGTFYWMRSTVVPAEAGAPGAGAPGSPRPAPGSSSNLPDAGYDWSVRSLDGRVIPFSSFKGKTIFLNFWATWCGPCQAEMPAIERMYQKVKGKGIEVVAASWEDPLTVANWVQRSHFSFPVYTFERPAPASYASEGIPVTFIISPAGKVVRKHLDPDNWDSDANINFLLSL